VTPHQRKIADIASKLLEWYPKNARDLPWRHTNDPYCVFVSEIMLQQTQVKTVIPYWGRWMEALPSVQALAKASPQVLHKLWEGLGYYTRVRNMHRAAQVILEKHNGKFPDRFEEVLQLPGIGRYTAGAICSIAFNQPRPILDGNIIRVLARVFAIGGDPKSKEVNASLWELAEQLVQHAALLGSGIQHPASAGQQPVSTLNQALMELGALVCTPRQPGCESCALNRHCLAFQEGRVSELPRLRPRPQATQRRFIAFVAEKEGRFLVRQRPAGVVNAHLWEFPNLEVVNGATDLRRAARQETGVRPRKVEPLCSVKHSITRYRITLDVFRVHPGRIADKPGNYRWAARATLLRLPFSSAHRKVVGQLTRKDGSGAAH